MFLLGNYRTEFRHLPRVIYPIHIDGSSCRLAAVCGRGAGSKRHLPGQTSRWELHQGPNHVPRFDQELHAYASPEHAEPDARYRRLRRSQPVVPSFAVGDVQRRQPVEVLPLLHVCAGVRRQRFREEVDCSVQVRVSDRPLRLRAGDEEKQLLVA